MTTPQALDSADAPEGDAPIAAYLQEHPDFFMRHEDLLALLRLPHARGGATISLVERQVEVLRDKNHALESRLAELVAVARGNEALVEKIHRFTRRLVTAQSRQDAISQVQASLQEDFQVPSASLFLFGGAMDAAVTRFVNIIEARDPGLAQFESVLSSGKPRCGQLRDGQREFLFGTESSAVQSVALVPLGAKEPFGLLALGSPDRDRFNPGMSTEFLTRMGELLADALARP